jgi:hypothetical protein
MLIDMCLAADTYSGVNMHSPQFHISVFPWNPEARIMGSTLNVILLQESPKNGEQPIQWEHHRAK